MRITDAADRSADGTCRQLNAVENWARSAIRLSAVMAITGLRLAISAGVEFWHHHRAARQCAQSRTVDLQRRRINRNKDWNG
jgi:hypothetical protein